MGEGQASRLYVSASRELHSIISFLLLYDEILSFVMLYAERSGFRFIVMHAMESYLWPFWNLRGRRGGKKKKKKKKASDFDTDWTESAEGNQSSWWEKLMSQTSNVNSSRMQISALADRPQIWLYLLARTFYLIALQRISRFSVKKAIACNLRKQKKGPAVLQYRILSD